MSAKPEAWRAIDSLIWPHIAAKLVRRQHAENERLHDELRQSSIDITRAEVERLREALDRSLTDEQIRQIAASIDRSMPLDSAKILFARRIEAALRRED